MKAVVFDTETTGLIDNHSLPLDKQPEIIDIYLCQFDLDAGAIEEEYETLIHPSRPIPVEAANITGITDEDVKDAPAFGAVAPRIKNLLEAADIIIGHNLSYDKEIIDLEFERIENSINWPERMLCTVEATVYLCGFRLSLTNLHQYLFETGFAEAHRAKSDASATMRCAVELRKRGII